MKSTWHFTPGKVALLYLLGLSLGLVIGGALGPGRRLPWPMTPFAVSLLLTAVVVQACRRPGG